MKKIYIITLLSALSFSLSGCLSGLLKPEEDPTVFYVLKEKPAKDSTKHYLNMNVSPIALPNYMDKPQVVSYLGANTLLVSEINRWGEPLNNAVARVIYLNFMSNSAPNSKIYAYPMAAFDSKLPTLSISINELCGTLGKESTIKATWTLGDPKANKLLADGVFEKTIANGKSYAGYVDSISTLLSDLSLDIIDSIFKSSKATVTIKSKD
ncbi:MAG: PqiC family protein [Opitutales bacterium]